MNPKLIKMCGPCGDVPVLKTVAVDCATGQPSTLGATCATPLFVKSCDPVQQDCEIALAMNPATLEIVIVTLCFVGGVPTTTLTNVDGSPYVGPQPIALDKEWNFQTHTLCDGGTQTVTRTDVFVDGGQAPSFSIWQDITGAVIPAPAPGGLSYGACQPVTARKLIAALPAHICAAGVPAGYVGYDFDIPSQFPGTTDTNDLYLHILYYNPGVQPDYFIPPGSNATGTAPLIVTDPSIQTHIDAALASWGLNPGDVLWQVNPDNTVTVWYSPTFIISDLSFWAGPNVVSGYTGKDYPQIATVHSPTVGGVGCSNCHSVQLEKWLESDGVTVTEELYDIGTRNLVALAPGDTLAWGPCPEAAPAPTLRTIKMGWQQIVGAPFSLADALAMGGSRILSYTIKQISGQGAINGDTGGGVLIDAGESWSAGTNTNDVLSTVTSFDPGSGIMRLTWQYI